MEQNATTSVNVPGTKDLFQKNRGSNAERRSQGNFTAVPTPGETFYAVPYWVNDHMGLPKPELENFHGDPTQYPRFVSNFDAHIASKLGPGPALKFYW